jgi:hypothetical protein
LGSVIASVVVFNVRDIKAVIWWLHYLVEG